MTRTRLIAVALLALAFSLWLAPRAARWLAIDKCLDSGGRWNEAQSQCERWWSGSYLSDNEGADAEGGEETMNRDYVLWNLREAAEAVTDAIKEIEADPEYDDGQFQLALNHLYDHLNTAWNARNASTDQTETCSAEDFQGWRQFPTDIDMSVWLFVKGINYPQSEVDDG
jgi:hypothetical protein